MCDCNRSNQNPNVCRCSQTLKLDSTEGALPKLRLEVGKKYLLRDNSVVRVLATDKLGRVSVVLMKISDGHIYYAFADGRQYEAAGQIHSRDIVAEYREPRYIYTVWKKETYGNGVSSATWRTEEQARAYRDGDIVAIARINLDTFQVEQLPLNKS